MPKCEFVNLSTNIVCGSTNQITKIVFNSNLTKIPLVFFACRIHGDLRFNVLSFSEKLLQDQKKSNAIDWENFKETMKNIRWKNCRKCNREIGATATYCIEYFWIREKENKIGLRRSFILDSECAKSELRLYGIGNEIKKDQTLDSIIK